MRRIKVCVINPNYYRSSGVTVAIRRLCEGSVGLPIDWLLVDCGHGDDIHLTSPDDTWRDDSQPLFAFMSRSPLTVIRAAIRFRRLLRDEAVDVLHVHHRRLALLCGWVARSCRIPVVYTSHLVYESNAAFRWAPINRVIAISESVLANVKELLRNLPISLVSNATVFPTVVSVIPESAYRQVLCIARLEPVKNHELLLRAWAMINPVAKGYRLTLLGEGSQRERLQKLAADLSLGDSVDFAGYTNDVSSFINKSLFTVLFSWHEGQPIVILESAAYCRASLVSNVNGSRDCVAPDAILPNLISPDAPDDLAATLKFWLENPETVAEEGKRFFVHWRSMAAPDVVAAQTLAIYKSVLSESNVRRALS